MSSRCRRRSCSTCSSRSCSSSARSWTRAASSTTSSSSVGTFLVNTLEPIQAYVAWTLPDSLQTAPRAPCASADSRSTSASAGSSPATATATRSAPSRAWTGSGKGAAGQNARAFYLIPMRILPATFDELLDDDFELDRGQRDSAVWGGFYQFPKTTRGDTVEVYGFYFDAVGAAADPAALLGHLVGRHTRVSRSRERPVELRGRGRGSDRRIGRHRRAATRRTRPRPSRSPAPLRGRLSVRHCVGRQPDFPIRRRERRRRSVRRRQRALQHAVRRPAIRIDDDGDLRPVQSQQPATRKGCASRCAPNPRLQGMLHYRSFRLAAARDTWVGIGARDPTGRAGDSLGSPARRLDHVGRDPGPARRSRLASSTSGSAASRTKPASPAGGDPTYIYLRRLRASKRVDWKAPALREEA